MKPKFNLCTSDVFEIVIITSHLKVPHLCHVADKKKHKKNNIKALGRPANTEKRL